MPIANNKDFFSTVTFTQHIQGFDFWVGNVCLLVVLYITHRQKDKYWV